MPFRASSVVVQSCLADTRSNSGTGSGPFFLNAEGFPFESTDVDEALASDCRTLDTERESEDVRGEPDVVTCNDGSTSFFCLEAGRISSRSTGTPRETRNRRRMRERIQSGGANGGGATNCDHKDALRGVRKMGFSLVIGGGEDTSKSSGGNSVLRYESTACKTSSPSKPSKSGMS